MAVIHKDRVELLNQNHHVRNMHLCLLEGQHGVNVLVTENVRCEHEAHVVVVHFVL